MSNVTYDILWREAIMELLDQLEAENPDDSVLAPKDLAEWTCIYVKYVQIYRKLEGAYDQMLHPQKRSDAKSALQSCMGRMLEVRHYLVQLNNGLDFVNLDDILVDLKLPPDVVEIPVPRYFLQEKSAELEDRGKYLDALMEKFEIKPKDPEESIIHDVRAELKRIQIEEQERQTQEQSSRPPTPKDPDPSEAAPGEKEEMDDDKAAITIQSAIRGMQWRRKIKEEEHKELIFIGMKPKEIHPDLDPACIEVRNLARRKDLQEDHYKGYQAALQELKQRVRLTEGQDMRETIQDKINAWFVENRDPITGEYPSFPEEGGSKIILNPPVHSPEDDEEPNKETGNNGDTNPEKVMSPFTTDIEQVVESYMTKWQDRDEQNNFRQTHDVELVKEELRPIIFEDIRQQVDAEVSVMLQNLKEMLESERDARGKKGSKKGAKGKKGKKGKGDKKGKKGKKDPTADRSVESLYSELVSADIVKKCPLVEVHDYVGIFNFLGATFERAGTIPDPSMAQIRQLLTEYFILPLGCNYIHSKHGSGLNAENVIEWWRRVPHLKTVLLYGHASTGKTMLSRAIAHASGAHLFDISPRNTDGKYSAKQASLLVHMVFKVAKIMAPSVIYVDECEKVFVTDKKKMKDFGGSEPFSRIKKDLVKEVKALIPGERVLVIGNSREPQMCIKKDEKAFINFWDKHIYLPLPDYSSRNLLWPELFKKHGAKLPYEFDLSTLAHLSDGLTSGSIHHVVRSLTSPERLDSSEKRLITLEEIHQCMSLFHPVNKTEQEEMRLWTEKLPNRATQRQDGQERTEPKKSKTEKPKK